MHLLIHGTNTHAYLRLDWRESLPCLEIVGRCDYLFPDFLGIHPFLKDICYRISILFYKNSFDISKNELLPYLLIN